MSDRYATFDALRSAHEEGRDFRVEWRLGVSGIAVMAPHGGGIEPGTSEVARALAGFQHSLSRRLRRVVSASAGRLWNGSRDGL
jgi:phage replication-related protein YjqB (UPF0714/DUF867 family)